MNSREYLDNFARRLIQDAICSAAPEQYEARARVYDRLGKPEHLETARALRNAAEFWRRYGPELIAEDLDNVWSEYRPRGWAA